MWSRQIDTYINTYIQNRGTFNNFTTTICIFFPYLAKDCSFSKYANPEKFSLCSLLVRVSQFHSKHSDVVHRFTLTDNNKLSVNANPVMLPLTSHYELCRCFPSSLTISSKSLSLLLTLSPQFSPQGSDLGFPRHTLSNGRNLWSHLTTDQPAPAPSSSLLCHVSSPNITGPSLFKLTFWTSIISFCCVSSQY